MLRLLERENSMLVMVLKRSLGLTVRNSVEKGHPSQAKCNKSTGLLESSIKLGQHRSFGTSCNSSLELWEK